MELNDCPICMDCIVSTTNKVVTECGHCFHTNCLMASIAHNGFGCPCCRAVMAQEPETEQDQDDEESYEYLNGPSNQDEYDEEQLQVSDSVLRGLITDCP